MGVTAKRGFISLEYANGIFAFGQNCKFEPKKEGQKKGKETLACREELSQKYQAVFKSFLDSPQSPEKLQEEIRRFDGAYFESSARFTVIALADTKRNLARICCFVGETLLDLEKLPKEPLQIGANSINGMALNQFAFCAAKD